MNGGARRIEAPLVVDGDGRRWSPGAVLVDAGRIIAAGRPADLGPTPGARTERLAGKILIPAMVNTHTHLDLTHIGPQPPAASFAEWAGMIRQNRQADPEAIQASVRSGVDLARAGGTAFVGDIAGGGAQPEQWIAAVETVRSSPLGGVCYVEVFGLGRREEAAIRQIREITQSIPHESCGVRLGLQPHALYSCASGVYTAAAMTGLAVASHVAETSEEIRFTQSGNGPLAEMLARFGVWDASIKPPGGHPVDILADLWDVVGASDTAPPSHRHSGMLAAHLNYIDERHLARLARAAFSVAYCPRASAYFGHPQDGEPRHRYREMLDAGICVTLGTDSIVCLDTPERISVLDEMRLLYRRDRTDPEVLLRMATVNGAKALDQDNDLVTFRVGPTAGILAVPFDQDRHSDPLTAALLDERGPRWVA